jgi:hypothetical protein
LFALLWFHRTSNNPERVFPHSAEARTEDTAHLLVSPPGSLVFVEGDRLSNSFGLWALSKTGGVGSFLPGLTGRHMRDPTSPRFQFNFAIRHGQVSGNRKRLNYRHSGTIDTVERDYRHSGTFSAFWRRAGVVRCLFLVLMADFWSGDFGSLEFAGTDVADHLKVNKFERLAERDFCG